MPYLLSANDIIFDWVIATHAHYDHFDVDSMPIILSNEKTQLISARDGRVECERLNLPLDKVMFLGPDEMVKQEGFKLKAIPCDHGELAPDAIGLLLMIGNKRIYITGDTSYRPDLLDNPELRDLDLLILPINGQFGNLDEYQASLVANILKPGLVIPCHFWNFAEHGGDPNLFTQHMKKNANDVEFTIMRMGGGLVI